MVRYSVLRTEAHRVVGAHAAAGCLADADLLALAQLLLEEFLPLHVLRIAFGQRGEAAVHQFGQHGDAPAGGVFPIRRCRTAPAVELPQSVHVGDALALIARKIARSAEDVAASEEVRDTMPARPCAWTERSSSTAPSNRGYETDSGSRHEDQADRSAEVRLRPVAVQCRYPVHASRSAHRHVSTPPSHLWKCQALTSPDIFVPPIF